LLSRRYRLELVIEPLDVLRLFTERYGVPFRILDSQPAKLLVAETVAVSTTFDNLVTQDLTAVGVKGLVLWPCFIGDITTLSSPEGGVLADILLGFLLNLSAYIETLRRHRVDVPDDLLTRFKEPLFPLYST
jgi:hypothetical protein